MGKEVFVWSRGRNGEHPNMVTHRRAPTLMCGALQDDLGMRDGKGYHLHAEEAPLPPEPEPEGEMKREILLLLSCNHGTYIVSPTAKLSGIIWTDSVGVYSMPKPTSLCGCHSLAVALATIRDAGGKCLAGEPLPERAERAERTWPMLVSGYPYPWRCAHCLGGYLEPRPVCGYCGVPLKGEVPWDSTAYRNKEC